MFSGSFHLSPPLLYSKSFTQKGCSHEKSRQKLWRLSSNYLNPRITAPGSHPQVKEC
jgi:hypothetical protein